MGKDTKTIKEDKWLDYSIKIQDQIANIFGDENDDYPHINQKELENEENLKHFLYALMCAVPTQIFNKLVGDNKSVLEGNHVANSLIVEFATFNSK